MNQYRKKFFKNGEVYDKNVKKTLAQLMYCQMMDGLKEVSKDLPEFFRENKLKWCSLMVKTPKMQEFYVNFTNKLNEILKEELDVNGDILQHYLNQPRKMMSVDSRFKVKTAKELASDLYPTFKDEKSLKDREMYEIVETKRSKYNFRKLQQEKTKKQNRGRGMQKHL